MRITAYTICLNEAKHIDRWLEATKSADLRVIVDTGSTDGTWERLQYLADYEFSNLKVHQIKINPWRFDDARNAALALVPTDIDVCVSIDMDEVAQPGFFETLRKEWKKETTIGWHRINTGPTWEVTRIHKRFGFRWKDACHEVFKPYGGTPEVVQNFDIQIDHKPDDTKSRAQYLDLLKMAVEENPENGRMWVYLCREYSFNKDWNGVLEASGNALECDNTWSVERSFVCRLAADAAYELGQDAEPMILEGLKHDPDSIEMQYCAAYYYYTKHDWEKVATHAGMREKLQPTNHYLRIDEVWDWRCWDMLGIANFNMAVKVLDVDWAAKAIDYQDRAVKNCNNPDEKKRLSDNLEMMFRAIYPHTRK